MKIQKYERINILSKSVHYRLFLYSDIICKKAKIKPPKRTVYFIKSKYAQISSVSTHIIYAQCRFELSDNSRKAFFSLVFAVFQAFFSIGKYLVAKLFKGIEVALRQSVLIRLESRKKLLVNILGIRFDEH